MINSMARAFFKSIRKAYLRLLEAEVKAMEAAAAAAATRAKQRAAGRLAAHIIPSLPEVHHATRPAFIFPYRSSHPPRGEG